MNNKMNFVNEYITSGLTVICSLLITILCLTGCSGGGVVNKDNLSAAEKTYVPPGKYDEFYAFLSGGYSGQIDVYGLPSGRLFKVIPVFSQDPCSGYGYSEETKPLLMTSYGFLPWDDLHHLQISRSNAILDGRWLFANGNNTPRIARIDLPAFETVETIELPNCAGNHSSPYISANTEYAVGGGRFSIPVPNKDVSINSYKQNFKGILSFVKIDPKSGHMKLGFQLLVPGYDYDLARFGKGPSKDWCFFTSYNAEQAHTLLEVNASQFDKDYTIAVNWKKLAALVDSGKGETFNTKYCHNILDPNSRVASTNVISQETVLTNKDYAGCVYFLPTAKSPHGMDVDPTGEYMTAGGKLAAEVTIFSFKKMLAAIENQAYEKSIDNIPVLKYSEIIATQVAKPGLGPLHNEFDDSGNGYVTNFISSDVTKYNVQSGEVLDKIPVYYSPGHLLIPGGDTSKPWGKYLVALNKITKDRYLPTGPDMDHSAQLIDISGAKMKLLLDFPTHGEPHYGQAILASMLMPKSVKFFDLAKSTHPYVTKSEKDVKVTRKGNEVHVYMTEIRSHMNPDNIQGIKVGDKVYFHVTSLEQSWSIGHGFAILGGDIPNIRVMSGETKTVIWTPKHPGIYPFYCTDFCSALHQEMQGYVQVVGANTDKVPLSWSMGNDKTD